MRGPGDLQVNFAVESHMDYLAHKLGIDPTSFAASTCSNPATSCFMARD